MDKITAGIIDKLSIIGFFNVILSGGLLLYGLSPVLNCYLPGIFYGILGVEDDLEKGIVLCLACYLLGSALQSVQEYLYKGLKSSVANKCLAGPDLAEGGAQGKGVLPNPYRRKAIIKLAEKMFSDKELGEFDPEDKEKCSCFIDYCDYSNTIKGYSSKSGKLSDQATFFEQLAVAFYTLVLVGIPLLLTGHTGEWLYCLGYLIMGGIFTGRAYQCRLKWAQNVLLTYEAVGDHEESEKEKD